LGENELAFMHKGLIMAAKVNFNYLKEFFVVF